MNYDSLTVPVKELILNLHSYNLHLPPAFDIQIIPKLQDFSTTDEYTCVMEDGVLDRAKWIHEGYGYAVRMVEGREGERIELIVDIFKPKAIMLDENGFFNNVRTDLIYKLARGTTAVPFSRQDFAQLYHIVPEAQHLATKILSALHEEERTIRDILKMKVEAKKVALEKHFGFGIYQYFDKKDLAPFFGMAPETMSRS